MSVTAIERLNAALGGRYHVEHELGEGGMATVYLADDLKHERKVALKVLKPELAAVVGADRFLAEIKTTANLQHPHILPLFDSGEADSFLFYVMPWVEGETLRQRIERERQLGVEDSLAISRKVANALDYAHGHGVVHRDVKPANILLSEQGEPLVADFGIALAVAQAGGGRITETGLSLGTPHYMSPEQATGDRDVDPRSDVYALGCVLYEMLAGEPPFSASTAQAILAKILTMDAPSITMVRKTVPPNVGAAIAKALEKLPADRFTSAADFSLALTDQGFAYRPRSLASSVPPEKASGRQGRTTAASWSELLRDWRFLALAVLAGVSLAAAVRPVLAPSTPGVTTRVGTTLEPGLSSLTGPRLAISPDGRWYAWIIEAREGGDRLYIRRSDESTGHPVPGSGNATFPVFSPDGAALAFRSDGALMRVSVSGGPALTLAEEGFNATHWSEGGTIVGHARGAVYRVSEAGGVPEEIIFTDASGRIPTWAEMLPGEEALLYTSFRSFEDAQVRLFDLRTDESRTLVEEGWQAHYLASGHLVFGHSNQALFGVGFDQGRGEVVGSPVPVLAPLLVHSSGALQFAVARNGSVIYQQRGTEEDVNVVLVDSLGGERPLPIPQGERSSPRFSPDERMIAYVDGSVYGDVYSYSLDLGNTSQLTFEGINQYPFWATDSALVTFASQRVGTQGRDGFRVASDMAGTAEKLFDLPGTQHPQAWSPDGHLLVRVAHPEQGQDLRILAFSDDSVTVTDYLTARWDELAATISPDGKWAAYVSDEEGADEVYVRAFPRPAGVVKVSVDGGGEPVWASDGRALYYRVPNGDLMAARVRTEPTLTVVARERLFSAAGYYAYRNFAQYDVNASGEFVMLKLSSNRRTLEFGADVVIVTNWFEELRRLVPN